MITSLDPTETEAITARVVATLIREHGESLRLLTPSQVCGLLDVTPKTLLEMKLPKVDLLNNGRAIRYRLKDIEDFITERTIKAAAKQKGRRSLA